MGRATWIRLVVAIGSVVGIGSVSGQTPAQSEPRTSMRRSDVPLVIKAVEEWETIPTKQAGLPQVDANEVLAKVRGWAEAFEKLTSWEARYETTYTQGSPSPLRRGTRFQMISNGRRWYSRQQDTSPDPQQSQPWEATCDGDTVRMVWPDKKEVLIQKAGETIGWGSAPTLPAFFPQIPADPALRYGHDLPNLLDSLNDSRIRLLPVCTRVNDRPCYVLERIVREERPVFKSQQEADQWDKEHKDEQASSDGSIPTIRMISPTAKPGDKTSRAITTWLAVDPKLGFAVVRWALGTEGHHPGLDMTVFPDRELICQDFHKVDEGVQMPFRVEFTRYRATEDSRREVSQQFRLVVGSFVVRSEWEPALFTAALLDGYNVVDTIRGIVYTVGDSQDKIDRLSAAAQARNAFYRRLREGPVPALRASTWIGGDPIDPATCKGRSIILHFWSITCGPCLYELPRLQAQYGNTLKFTEEPLFISIHSHTEGRDLEKVRQILKSQGITFPVMIDSPCADPKYWGDTFYRYRIFSMPHEIRIDENGRVAKIEEELISESSWWVNKGQDK